MVGVIVDPRGHEPMLSPRARRSVDMRRAAKLAIRVVSRPGYRLALRDIHAALTATGDDAFVFASHIVRSKMWPEPRQVVLETWELPIGPTCTRTLIALR